MLDFTQQTSYSFPHQIQSWVMPLVAFEYEGDELVSAKGLGTAFAIGPQLVLTAKHNVESLVSKAPDRSLSWKPNVVPYVLFLSPEGIPGHDGPGTLIPLQAGTTNVDHDLAIFTTATLDSPTGEQPKFTCGPLTVVVPPIDSVVLALGYANMDVKLDRFNEDGIPVVKFEAPVIASKGHVQQHHVPRRDISHLTFPVVEGDYPMPSGMSGGPVIMTEGRVCGVMASSFDSLDGTTWTSYCSLLPYLFPLSVQMRIDGVSKAWSISELADRGMVLTDGSQDRVVSTMEGDQQTMFWLARDH